MESVEGNYSKGPVITGMPCYKGDQQIINTLCAGTCNLHSGRYGFNVPFKQLVFCSFKNIPLVLVPNVDTDLCWTLSKLNRNLNPLGQVPEKSPIPNIFSC